MHHSHLSWYNMLNSGKVSSATYIALYLQVICFLCGYHPNVHHNTHCIYKGPQYSSAIWWPLILLIWGQWGQPMELRVFQKCWFWKPCCLGWVVVGLTLGRGKVCSQELCPIGWGWAWPLKTFPWCVKLMIMSFLCSIYYWSAEQHWYTRWSNNSDSEDSRRAGDTWFKELAGTDTARLLPSGWVIDIFSLISLGYFNFWLSL